MGRKLVKTEFDSTPRQIYSRIPMFVGMIFEERIAEYHIRSRADVVCYLVDQYILNRKGLPASRTALKILGYAEKEHPRIVSFAPTMSMSFNMPGDLSVELAELALADGFGSRHYFINAVIMAFCVAPPRFGRALARELNEIDMSDVDDGEMLFTTYVSRLQHRLLKEKADLLGLSLSGLLRTAVEVLFGLEFSDGPCSLPDGVAENMRECMGIQGSTVKRFNRDVAVTVVISTEDQEKILKLIRKYGIQGPREFTRRLILFFLNSDLCEDTREEEAEEEENEYEVMERRGFAWEVAGFGG